LQKIDNQLVIFFFVEKEKLLRFERKLYLQDIGIPKIIAGTV